ncbi:OmpL47-type beta-barrel domain-containing protein [Pseudoduganella namucuonensis]|uniref:Alginate lyase n=1 Tax=Pseudoduganella namucuonensis TaxID=1035707 RepID=A0A1I7H6S2_9BURK|nr:discoidin domain-containing protein [Pseudoduganella namucuonensis]SFU56339.1 Alginate lyase [Pseudoduganella namucuonensis]
MKRIGFRIKPTRIAAMLFSIGIIGTLLPHAATAADTIETLATAYQPTIYETIDASGFKHPGVGLTKEMLENVRAQVLAQKEPWNTHFNAMLLSGNASKTINSSNQGSDPTKPGSLAFSSQGFNSKFIADGQKAYTQALLYYITGDETYRANAMRIIRIWAQMDPAQYVYFVDSHIHTGIPLSRMVAAAEIMRYTSCQTAALAWTDDDTAKFSTNLVNPVIETFQHTNYRFMNQHLYPLLGAMSGYIFTGNRARYNEGVEWFTVNKTAEDQGQNGAIKALFRLVEKNDVTGEAVTPVVQHVEMGRDQAHGGGDITNAGILARLLNAQGTKVDPVEGTASTAPNAVGPYEFLNDRILDASDYFARYMVGDEPPWVPTASHTDANGVPTVVYREIASGYRGRMFSSLWEPYYYYKYVKGVDIAQRAPFLSHMFSMRTSYNWDGVDGGGDYWLFMPAAAEAEGAQLLMKPITDPYREVEDRYTVLDGDVTAMRDETASFLRINTTAAGAKLAVVGYGNSTKTFAFKIRTNGIASLEAFDEAVALPDTKGQWRYVNYTLDNYHGLYDVLFLTVKGAGTQVDFDHINVSGSTFTAPVFTEGDADLSLVTYATSSSAVNHSFAATDAGADVLTYQVDNLPAGATFDTATGAFSWLPTQSGTYSFVVTTTDGTTVTSKVVKIVVTGDRQTAIGTIIAAYKPNSLYVAATLDTYNAAYADAVNAAGSATDAVFQQKLTALTTAVTGLQELTPLLADGSMNYRNMFTTSTFGTAVPLLLDNAATTWSTAPGTYAPNLAHIMDFGPDFKASASTFQMQVRASFPERIGGVAMFGSNDNENWTRLTPGLTVVSDDMQTLPVQEDQKNQRYRFFKLQMVAPTYAILEVGEFRIFGQRYETVNKISAVSISSDQSLKKRIVPGNTVKVTFQSKEAINNVNVMVQGQPATVTTSDNLNWTATWVANASAAAGTVKFVINYKTAAGVDAEPTLFTTDSSSLFISDQTGLINPIGLTTLSDSSGRNQTDVLGQANVLLDSNLGTFTDFRVNGSGNGGWIEFDFKGGGLATLNRVEVIGRQDQYASRINGTVVQGSNDNATWDTISPASNGSSDWQTLKINSLTPYRYIRVVNGNAWYGNMAELRMYGAVESVNMISTASLSSTQALRNRIVPGNTVKVAFTAKEAINTVSATIQGVPATVATTDNINFTATATLPQGVAAGAVTFAINYKTAAGKAGYPNTATTDGTLLTLVDEADVIKNVTSVATLIDSTVNRTAASTLSITNSLFDSNLGTFSDYRTGSNNAGTGSYITFDFKAGNQATLTGVELAARQDQTARAKGTVVQGSNDNTNWTTLTAAAITTADWQTLPVSGGVPYRYIRVVNGNNWFGNLAEVRFHGTVQGADTTAPTTTSNAPAAPVKADTTVAFSATDTGSGVAATYYKVNGGAQQTGAAAVLTTEGTHTLSYWSVDKAGNVEPARTATVTIDRSAPVTVATASPAAPANGWYSGNVSLALAVAADAGSPAASTHYTVDGGAQQTGNTVALSAKGTHTVSYWSVDQAGNTEQARSLTVNIGPIDLSASVKMTQQGATLNRATGKYVGAMTLTNTTGSTLTGPLTLRLNGLSNGLVLDNATGVDAAGAPYVALANPLAPGGTVTVNLTFSNPNRALVTYSAQLFRGQP